VVGGAVALAHELTEARGGDGAEFFAAVETAERERNGERERGVRCQLGLHICACARDVEASAERERHAVARL
jgi:hypothetical protein